MSGASATISAGFLSSINTAASQIRASGWGQVQGASASAGQIDIGATAANQGRVQYSSAGSTTLYIDNSFDDTGASVVIRTRTAVSAVTAATFTNGNTTLGGTLTVTGAFGCNTKAAQTAYVSGGALAAYGAGANGLDSGANMSALHALVVNIRAALVADGIMS